uniref:Uncharacterized protein n=1 Tax=viral metagenome TaxID=1070528 RepID=A0A6C0J6U0_9ZZZZ
MGAFFSKDEEEQQRANRINDIKETLRKAKQQRQSMEAINDTEDEAAIQLLQEGGFIDPPAPAPAPAQTGGFFMVCA